VTPASCHDQSSFFSDRAAFHHSNIPAVRAGLPRSSHSHPQYRPAHRRPQRHPGRDPRTGRTRLRQFRGPPTEVDDRHPPATRRPRRWSVLGRLRAGHEHGLGNPRGHICARANRPRAPALQQERPQPGDGVHRRRRRAQLCRRQGLLPDRHRGRPRDRELARRAPHVLQARHALHHADALAQPRPPLPIPPGAGCRPSASRSCWR